MAAKKMGFEGSAFQGTAGSIATNQLTNARDIKQDIDAERGETTVRGTSLTPPMKCESVCVIVNGIEITMLNDASDTNFEAMRVAAAAGTALAIRLKDHSAGKGFNGDCTLTASMPYPLKGEQVITFTCTPNNALREPVPYV